MYFLIIFIGIVLLIVNFLQWRRNIATFASETTIQKKSLPYIYINTLWREWKLYALGDYSIKGMKGLIIAIVSIIVLLLVNANWFQFDVIFLLLASVFIAFVTQIRVGRALRRRYFESSFPEVLSVINSAVSAGNSIHQALHRCGEGIDGDLGKMFKRIDRRLNLGEEPERVFNDAWKEYQYRELYFFNIVMLVSMQLGGQLRVLVGRLSRIITNSKNMARRKAAITSEARMSAKIVAAMPLLFFCGMKYFSPENFEFVIHDSLGRIVLYYVIISEAIGMAIIFYLVKKAT
ncbi:TPA: type II secretion system F family protein [Escherichia coli]|uniref:type II secretion system F family protein n=1 Tax=Escherichia coli TaxID=562 RepID=UPI000B7D3C42|nr:type II secretion system F family protein [Escherichia coli]EET7733078.1 secretion system protein [Escherichia coli]EFO3282412.1 secretion system protein [Escherichia coli]EKM1660000.1 type II secretion system F family protein [Escherichia coli]EMA2751363.1 type II secretion system F family protein [Escherichia coli]MDC9059698.1 type II secretion system F family protein [Escherichia coli]